MDDVAAAGGLAGGAQLLRGPLGPRGGAEVLEQRQRGAQVLAGVDPAAGAAQVLAEGQVGAGPVGQPQASRRARRGRRREVRLGVVAVGEQRPAVLDDGDRGSASPVPSANSSSSSSQVRSDVAPAGPDGGVEQVEGGHPAQQRQP